MTAFNDQEIERNWPIWRMFRKGGVILFRDRHVFERAITDFRENGYSLHTVSCDTASDEKSLCHAIVDALGVTAARAESVNNFRELVSRISFDRKTGVIVQLTGFDHFYTRFPEESLRILDVMADQHHSHLLVGNRFLTVAHTSDEQICDDIGKVGGHSPLWNTRPK